MHGIKLPEYQPLSNQEPISKEKEETLNKSIEETQKRLRERARKRNG